MAPDRRNPSGPEAVAEAAACELDEHPFRAAGQGVGASLRYLHRLYMRQLQRHLGARGLSVAQYLHLRILWEEEGLAQTVISRRLGIEKASSTAVLDALERDGLIERARDKGDRRRIIVQLSPKGRELQASIMPFARQVADRAGRDIPHEELDVFFSVIDRMVANLDRAEQAGPATGE